MGRTLFFTDWLLEILKLHFFWILYLLRGWVIAGIFPSTAAMYAVVRHWLMKKEAGTLSHLYKQYYQENFKAANILGWMFFVVTCIIAINIYYLPYYSEGMRLVMYPILLFFAVIVFIGWLYVFPTIVHYAFSISNYFVVILRMGFASLSGIIMQVFILGIFILGVYILPSVLVIFGITPLVLVQMAISYNIFQKLR